jgi:catalase
VFFFQDGIKFPDLIHAAIEKSLKRRRHTTHSGTSHRWPRSRRTC